MITHERFKVLEAAVREAGFGETIDWTENIIEPQNAEAFASETIYVICNSGMKNSVALLIFDRCMKALSKGRSVRKVFGHPGKAVAIDQIWTERTEFYARYLAVTDKLEYCETLPWIGPVTKFHLAKNFGLDAAKPDVHLERLAQAEDISVEVLCERLANQTGYRAATIDTILWRACAEGILNSRVYATTGWDKALNAPANEPNAPEK